MRPNDDVETAQSTVSDVGEAGLLKIIFPYLEKQGKDLIVGVGDDAAVLSPTACFQHSMVLTADMLVEGTHFPSRPNLQWRLLGSKAIAANLSDVAAMGGIPSHVLVSLGLPPDVALREVVALYDGMREMCQTYGVSIIGGDTVRSPQVIVSITAVGRMPDGVSPALRTSCRPGQNVYVSGKLGGSKAGLMLALNPSIVSLLEPRVVQVLLERHWTPQPQVTLGAILAMICPDLAMIDISDSLVHELKTLAEASSCGFDIYVDKIPFPPEIVAYCNMTNEKIEDYILFSGEEYELLFCTRLAPDQLVARLRELGQSASIATIGKVTESRGLVRFFDSSGREINCDDRTFEHFLPPQINCSDEHKS
ncbi:MAG: thiamine-phosphate kinase [Candidatus Sumerlaeaceae bacterium]|nr:thiamine-phosphate kinase [Candidatus Sumerlaeaceae bacterium]